MSAVRVTDVTLALADSTVTHQLAVLMVPGKFTAGREVDAELIHPTVREYLADWACGQQHVADELQELYAFVTSGSADIDSVERKLDEILQRYTK